MRKNKGKTGLAICGAFALVIGCTAMFSGLAEAAAAVDMKGAEMIPTAYTLPAAPETSTVPEGYQKAAYTVVEDPLDYYKDKKPSEKDLSQEKAAEMGAQLLWKMFGVKLDGATIYMGYDPGTATCPRESWSGDVRFGKSRTPGDTSYTFLIDAVTGEAFIASFGRTLNVTVDLGLDSGLEKNPSEYMKLAKAFAEKKNLVNGEVKECIYNSQGYGSNDPEITINVIGVNGQKAMITFSRYDQAVKGIGFNASMEIQEMMDKIMEQEAENWVQGGQLNGEREELVVK